jgi:hypothetical protein
MSHQRFLYRGSVSALPSQVIVLEAVPYGASVPRNEAIAHVANALLGDPALLGLWFPCGDIVPFCNFCACRALATRRVNDAIALGVIEEEYRVATLAGPALSVVLRRFVRCIARRLHLWHGSRLSPRLEAELREILARCEAKQQW